MSEHNHEHQHTYTHSHEHSHEAGHEHDHSHSHEHVHEGGQQLDLEKLQILLNHMKEHNEHHTAEVGKMADNAAALGKAEAAELLKRASLIYAEANTLLSEAIKQL